MKNEELIQIAANCISPKQLKEGVIGDVGCALIGGNGKLYIGVCVGTFGNSMCAEKVALGKMISDDNEYRIKKIVAVRKDKQGNIFVIPPCGSCRENMKSLHQGSLEEVEVILDKEKIVSLAELLPYHDWWKKQ